LWTVATRRVNCAPGLTVWHNVRVTAEALADTLVRIPMLAAVPRELRLRLAELSSRRPLARGELLFSEGEPASFLPLLLSGQVKLFRVGRGGREQVLHLVRAPASFAEAAVFGPGVYPASAEVIQEGELVSVPRDALLDLLRRRPEAALALLSSMSAWLRRLADLIEGLSLRTVEERVAAYLLAAFIRSGEPLRNGLRTTLEDPKHLVAALCGTAPEVLSRTFRRLEDDGAVRVDGPAAEILDVERLRRLAGHESTGSNDR
jgi:CRP-like cAMP-binding protein